MRGGQKAIRFLLFIEPVTVEMSRKTNRRDKMFKRIVACQSFIEYEAKRIDIRGRNAFAPSGFGCHISHAACGPHNIAVVDEPRGQPEIHDAYTLIRAN